MIIDFQLSDHYALGTIDACDENHIDYDSAECERKTKRNEFWGGFLKTGLQILVGGGGNQTPTKETDKTDKTEAPNKNSTPPIGYEAEKKLFESLSNEKKREYAKQNPTSKVVQEWQNARMWRNVAIGGGIIVGTGVVGYVVYQAIKN